MYKYVKVSYKILICFCKVIKKSDQRQKSVLTSLVRDVCVRVLSIFSLFLISVKCRKNMYK